MKIRRVVTSHAAGRSVIGSDGNPPRAKDFVHTPGFASALIWATGPDPAVPHGGVDPTPGVASFVPQVGETRFLIVSFPPDSVVLDPAFDPVAAGREHLQESPGIADRFEPDDPGMHTTQSVDYGIVLEGEIWLELDDGKTVHLRPHDVVVQNGTRHAWRNKGQAPATLAFVLTGARKT